MRWYRELYIDILVTYGWGKPRKTSGWKPSDKGCVTIHRLKWELLAPNDVDRIAQHTREGEGSNEGKDRGPGPSRPSNMLVHIYMVQYIYHSASSRKSTRKTFYIWDLILLLRINGIERYLTNKYKPIVCALKNCNLNSREKFESGGSRFKSRFRFEFFSWI